MTAKYPKIVKNNCKIFVTCLSNRTSNCMEDYLKPSLQRDPNKKILHVGTNGLILNKTLQDCATSIVNLVCSTIDNTGYVRISKIILRTDNKHFN